MTENTPRTSSAPVAEPVRSARRRAGGWTGLLLGAALVVMTLVAGLIFTFSAAVMPNLAGADDRTFVAAMQRFDANPVFPLSFTAALVLSALAVVLLRRHSPRAEVRWSVAAFLLCGIVVAVTAGLHMPLNEEIVRAGDPGGIADLASLRDQVEGPWVAGNIVRTLLCTAAVAALARALFLHGRSTADRIARPSSRGRAAATLRP